MSGRYVPPGRRQTSENAAGEKPPTSDKTEGLLSLGDIRAHFWPATENELPRFSETGEGRTLHDSAATPGKLAYIILFNGANPRWQSDHLIFSKSSPNLLPVDLADGKSKAPPAVQTDHDGAVDSSVIDTAGSQQNEPNDAANGTSESHGKGSSEGEVEAKQANGASSGDQTLPIAVFKQVRGAQRGRSFKFDSWYQIDKLAFLEPKSDELIKMLQQKWTEKNRFGNFKQEERSEEQWKQSLSYRWAVLKLKKDEVAEKEMGVPKVERLPEQDPESPKVAKKSVNEMLAELRMGEQKPNGEGAAANAAE